MGLMSQRTLLLVSAGLTGLGLLGAGFLIGRSPAPAAAPQAQTDLSPDREKAYRALIAEANARLTAQQRALDEAKRRSAEPVTDAPAAGPQYQLAQTEPVSPKRGHHHDDDEDDDD